MNVHAVKRPSREQARDVRVDRHTWAALAVISHAEFHRAHGDTRRIDDIGFKLLLLGSRYSEFPAFRSALHPGTCADYCPKADDCNQRHRPGFSLSPSSSSITLLSDHFLQAAGFLGCRLIPSFSMTPAA